MINHNNYKLWTTENVVQWVGSLMKKLSETEVKKLQQSMCKHGVNGYNITKQDKQNIQKLWGIKPMKHRKLIYKEIQKLKQIRIQFELWSAENVAQYVYNIFQSTKDSNFLQKLKQEVMEQDMDGTQVLELEEDDIQCLFLPLENEYKDTNELQNDRQIIYQALKTINENTEAIHQFCRNKETVVDNCLVIFFGIREYDDELFDQYIQNSQVDVDQDKAFLKQTFKNEYCYKFITNDIYKKWNPEDVAGFFQDVRNKYLWNASESIIYHNGLILC
eukprot:421107_1